MAHDGSGAPFAVAGALAYVGAVVGGSTQLDDNERARKKLGLTVAAAPNGLVVRLYF
jgi:hypothetical protein